MYKNIYIPVDNSDHSNMAIDVGIRLAKEFGAKVISSHVYAAKMHDRRFKQMEAGLPEEYHDEQELERQRKIHDSLITRGLQIITDSYLDVVEKRCSSENIPLEVRSLEGKNFKVLVDDINEGGYDLVVMGALGVGAVRDSMIGSVTERVIRRVRACDVFVIKDLTPLNGGGGKIAVAVDGSPQSFAGLKTALTLAKTLKCEIHVVSAFDPYFHYAMFNSIAGVLSEEAGKVFRFKQQEKLHEEVIDSGLAKIYQSHLEVSKLVAEEEGIEIKTSLLDGKPFDKVLQFVRREKPWLLIMGRIGVHSEEDMDVGSNTENLLRLVPCNVLITSRKFVPPIDAIAEYTVAWTEEATRRMDRVPSFARGMAKTAVYRYAIEKGFTIISNSVVDDAMGDILPASAVLAMKNLGKQLDEAGIDRDKMTATDGVVTDLVGEGLAGMVAQVPETEEKAEVDYYLCQNCGHTAKGLQPVKCPVCGAGGEKFKYLDKAIFLAAAKTEGNIKVETAYDDVQISWTDEARKVLKMIPAGFQRRRAKAKVEKLGRKRGMATITKEFTVPHLESEGLNLSEVLGQEKLSWTAEAIQRLEKVPPGYMRDCTKGMIVQHAEKLGTGEITLDIANIGIEEGKRTMEEAMKDPAKMNEILAKFRSAKDAEQQPSA